MRIVHHDLTVSIIFNHYQPSPTIIINQYQPSPAIITHYHRKRLSTHYGPSLAILNHYQPALASITISHHQPFLTTLGIICGLWLFCCYTVCAPTVTRLISNPQMIFLALWRKWLWAWCLQGISNNGVCRLMSPGGFSSHRGPKKWMVD